MATYRRDRQQFFGDSNTNFEVVMLTDNVGHFYSTTNPFPVTLGSDTITITGNVNVGTVVTVNSTPTNPVHTHLSEIGTSGILDVPYMPISGNVNASIINTANVIILGGSSNTIIHLDDSTPISTLNPMPIVSVSANTVASGPWELQVARGKVANVIQLNVFGYSSYVTDADYISLWESSVVYDFPASPAVLNVYSTSTSDAGATISISGLDVNYNMIGETVTLNSSALASTVNSYLRVNSFQMTTPNTNQTTNIGTVAARNAANVALIYPGVGRMQNSWYSIPAGYSMYVLDISIFSGETKTGATPTWFYYRVRNHNNITRMTYNVLTTSFQDNYKVTRANPVRYTEKSDISWQFKSSDNGPHTMGLILQALLIPDNAP